MAVIKKKKLKGQLFEFAVPLENWVKIEEAEQKKNLKNIIVKALGTITKILEKRVLELEIRGRTETV